MSFIIPLNTVGDFHCAECSSFLDIADVMKFEKGVIHILCHTRKGGGGQGLEECYEISDKSVTGVGEEP